MKSATEYLKGFETKNKIWYHRVDIIEVMVRYSEDYHKEQQKELLIDFYKYIDSEHPELWDNEAYEKIVNEYLNKRKLI